MLYSDTIHDNKGVEKVTVTNTGNYYLTIHPFEKGKQLVELVMNEQEIIDLRKKIEIALNKPKKVTEHDIERMVRIFTFESPYMLSFKYRSIEFRREKEAIINSLLRQKRIVQVSKNSMEVVYKYIGII